MGTTGIFHLRGETDSALDGAHQSLVWPSTPGSTDSVTSPNLGWNLYPLPAVSGAAADLLHLAAGAYMADRLTARGTYFRRDLQLAFNVLAPHLWTESTLNLAADLLEWLSGDSWDLTALAAPQVDIPDAFPVATTEPVALLSGGLDSFLGAIHSYENALKPVFVSHKDNSTAIRQAQSSTHRWLTDAYGTSSYTRVELSQAVRRRERSTRSRAFMFAAIGFACAVSVSSTTLTIAENGYTSINLPLRPNRGGALSTRSTHPYTFALMAELLTALEIDVVIDNPFAWLTKGEAMVSIAANAKPGWEEAAAKTISCGKLGGNFLGGSPNLNCGLCVPCLVRRATFIRADVVDKTDYLVNQLTGSDRDRLLAARRGDFEAVRAATSRGVESDAIDVATWPSGYDVDRAEDLVARGLAELAAVELP